MLRINYFLKLAYVHSNFKVRSFVQYLRASFPIELVDYCELYKTNFDVKHQGRRACVWNMILKKAKPFKHNLKAGSKYFERES